MSAVMARVGVERPRAPAPACAPLVRLLDDMASIVRRLSPQVYAARMVPGASGSIGEHVRHVLDHVTAFLGAAAQPVLSYDHRERGTLVEADPGVALRAIMRLHARLEGLSETRLDAPAVVSALVVRGEPPMLMRSTLRRELAFVISHTVHHQALIGVLLAVAGEQTPDGFGLAPSTPRRS